MCQWKKSTGRFLTNKSMRQDCQAEPSIFRTEEVTLDLLEDYNQDLSISSNLDTRFAALAKMRIRAHPLRYRSPSFTQDCRHVAPSADRAATRRCPLVGIQRRCSMVRAGPRIWNYQLVVRFGCSRWPLSLSRLSFLDCCYVLFVLCSIFLGTLENPEPRYTLECYPAIIVFASNLWDNKTLRSIATQPLTLGLQERCNFCCAGVQAEPCLCH